MFPIVHKHAHMYNYKASILFSEVMKVNRLKLRTFSAAKKSEMYMIEIVEGTYLSLAYYIKCIEIGFLNFKVSWAMKL